MTQPWRPHRFAPLAQLHTGAAPGLAGGRGASTPAQLQAALAEGFQEGLAKGYEQGHAEGLQAGTAAAEAAGRERGLQQGRLEALAQFEALSAPVQALFDELQTLQQDYQQALRREVVDLVERVARQVIRCELTLRPAQLLALVDETLAGMPGARGDLQVWLNPEDLQRLQDLAPERAAEWPLQADARLDSGEVRLLSDGRELDAGCRQRLAACMAQVRSQLQEPLSTEPAADTCVEAAP